jgi:hypothetical protein
MAELEAIDPQAKLTRAGEIIDIDGQFRVHAAWVNKLPTRDKFELMWVSAALTKAGGNVGSSLKTSSLR